MRKSKELSEDLRRTVALHMLAGLLEPFLSNYRDRDHQFKQMLMSKRKMCHHFGLEEDPNCHIWMKGNWLRNHQGSTLP